MWLLVFLDLRYKQWIFSKVVKNSDFWILSGWIEKYKPPLSKSYFSWDSWYCLRLAIASLAVNICKLQPLVSEDNFFCWVYNNFCSGFFLYDVIRCKFEKLNEDATLKREVSLQHLLRKLKQQKFFNETEYQKLYPSGSAPARIYGTPNMHKFSFSDLFPVSDCFIYRYF